MKYSNTATPYSFILRASPDDDDEEEKPVNPYADPNYPDLEFVNYDDPEYSVDQGTDEFKEDDMTEIEIEKMRESRRRRNDEYQFETYHKECLKSGDLFKGEWTIYRTSTFLPEGNIDGDIPTLRKERLPKKCISYGKKIEASTPAPEGGYEMNVDAMRLIHDERLATTEDLIESGSEEEEDLDQPEGQSIDSEIVGRTYWPDEMESGDFRGPAGIMCVGNGYTISTSVPLNGDDTKSVDEKYDGPFSEYRFEIGIQYKRMRFRVKYDYRVKGHSSSCEKLGLSDDDKEHPPLYLYSMITCRETRERWPRYDDNRNVDDSVSEKLFGSSGAPGGLYDPPPVGSDEQAAQYMLLDLAGGATVLFPYKIDQDPNLWNGNGWVASLDWTPGRIRYQLDRKMPGGNKLRGLKTLELTEVEGQEADKWRPKDGGSDMRQ